MQQTPPITPSDPNQIYIALYLSGQACTQKIAIHNRTAIFYLFFKPLVVTFFSFGIITMK